MGFPIFQKPNLNSITPVASSNIAATYRAIVQKIDSNNTILYSIGDQIIEKVTYDSTGAPIESYWNITTEPNFQIPTVDFVFADFITESNGTVTPVSKSMLVDTVVTLTDTPQTIAELLIGASLTLPTNTKYIEFSVDGSKLETGDYIKFGTYSDIVNNGVPMVDTVSFDTAEEISMTKFVAIPTVANRNIDCFIKCFNTPN